VLVILARLRGYRTKAKVKDEDVVQYFEIRRMGMMTIETMVARGRRRL
jgi:hypothetical protein